MVGKGSRERMWEVGEGVGEEEGKGYLIQTKVIFEVLR